MGYRIITDSASDLPAQLIDQLDVTVLPLHSVISSEKTNTTLDGTELPVADFYALLRQKYSAATSAVNVAAFGEAFAAALSAGDDVLCIAFSSGLSTTCQSAVIAAVDMAEKYPDRKVYVVDSLCASLGEGLLVWHAAKRRDAGASLEEVRDFLLETRLHLCHWFTVDDLFFLKRGGRVSATTAILGSMLNIKPVMHVDNAGHLINVEKAKGRRGSLQAMVNHMKATAVNPAEQTVFISHGDCLEDAELLASMVKEQLGVAEVVIGYVGQVIGTHSGPGTLALFFIGTDR